MTETITACENVCQDFSWLPEMMDVVTPLLAAAIALLIAFVAYPWQKDRVDRKSDLRRERRGAYRELAEAVIAIEHALMDARNEIRRGQIMNLSENIKLPNRNYHDKIRLTSLVASEEVSRACAEHQKVMFSVIKGWGEGAQEVISGAGDTAAVPAEDTIERLNARFTERYRQLFGASNNLFDALKVDEFEMRNAVFFEPNLEDEFQIEN